MGLISEFIKKGYFNEAQEVEKLTICLSKQEVADLRLGRVLLIKQNNENVLIKLKQESLLKEALIETDFIFKNL